LYLTRFFTGFCTVAKSARGKISNGAYAFIQGTSYRKIDCTSAFSILAGAEKVCIVLEVIYYMRELGETPYSYNLGLWHVNSGMFTCLWQVPLLPGIRWWQAESTCSLTWVSNYGDNML
jgi:hypothetical protein